jgi:hypothetical protein
LLKKAEKAFSAFRFCQKSKAQKTPSAFFPLFFCVGEKPYDNFYMRFFIFLFFYQHRIKLLFIAELLIFLLVAK